MKPSHLAAMMTADLIGSAGAVSSPEFQPRLEYVVKKEPQEKEASVTWSRQRRKTRAELSQRQLRKQRRRAHAAGKKNAYR